MISKDKISDIAAVLGAVAILTQTFLMISLLVPSILGHHGGLFTSLMVVFGAGCHLFIISRGYLPIIVAESSNTSRSSSMGLAKRVADNGSFREKIEVNLPCIAFLSGVILMLGDYILPLVIIHLCLASYAVSQSRDLYRKNQTLEMIEIGHGE